MSSDDCSSIKNEIDQLNRDKSGLQEDLKNAIDDGLDISVITKQINSVNADIKKKRQSTENVWV